MRKEPRFWNRGKITAAGGLGSGMGAGGSGGRIVLENVELITFGGYAVSI